MSQLFEYDVWSPSAPDKLYTVGHFFGGDFFTLRKSKLNVKILLHRFLFCRVRRWCTVRLRAKGDHTSDYNICDIRL